MALRESFRDKRKDAVEKIITVDSAMQGSLTFKDAVHLRINGKYEGTLEVRGILEIGDRAVVEATIASDEIIVSGRVKGDIFASHKILLAEKSVVEGNLKTPRLVVQEGAVFQGKCTMIGDIIDTDALARYLELDLNTVLEWANGGKIPGFREGDSWKFERKKIDEWISAGRVG